MCLRYVDYQAEHLHQLKAQHKEAFHKLSSATVNNSDTFATPTSSSQHRLNLPAVFRVHVTDGMNSATGSTPDSPSHMCSVCSSDCKVRYELSYLSLKFALLGRDYIPQLAGTHSNNTHILARKSSPKNRNRSRITR